MMVAQGIFMWDSNERRSQRYGYVYAYHESYDGQVKHVVIIDASRLAALDGKKVKLTVEIVEARDSGHVGDLFIGIKPTKPVVGEFIVLGIGTLHVNLNQVGGLQFALRPKDGREMYWFDPNLLYKCHNQTVVFHMEETTEEEHAAPVINMVRDTKSILAVEGGMQCLEKSFDKLKKDAHVVVPKATRLGDALLELNLAFEEGEEVKVIKKEPNY